MDFNIAYLCVAISVKIINGLDKDWSQAICPGILLDSELHKILLL